MSNCHHFRACLIVLLLSTLTSLSDPLHEDLTDLKTGRRFRAIVLRTSPRSYVVATEKGVEKKPRTHVQRNQRIKFAETARLNALFTSVETALARSRLDVARESSERIDEAIAEFDKAVAPKLFASSSTPAFKAAIEHAKEFYKTEKAAIEPTIKVFQTSKKILELCSELELGEAYDGSVLVEMAGLLTELNSVTIPVPLAKRNREDATKAIKHHIDKCETILIDKALKQTMGNWDISQVSSLLRTLKQAEKADPVFAKGQEKLLWPLLRESEEFSKKLIPIVKSGFSFNGDPKLDTAQLRLAERTIRNINAALQFIGEKVFGPDAEKYRKALADRVAENQQSLEQARVLRDKLQKANIDFSKAHATLQIKSFDETRALLKGVLTITQSAGVLSAPLEKAIKTRLLVCDGREILHQFTKVEATENKNLQLLLKTAKEFLAQNRNKLDALNISERTMSAEIIQLENYQKFQHRLESVRKATNEPLFERWQKISSLQAQLQDSEQPIHPAGRKIFNEFMEKEGAEIFAETVKAFEIGDIDFRNPQAKKIILSLVDKRLNEEHPQDASDLIAVAYEKIGKSSSSDPFVKQLIDKDIRAARSLSRSDSSGANKIFNRLRKLFPEYFRQRSVDELMLNNLLRQAQSEENSGDIAEAVLTYEKILRTDPDYAARVELFERILGLKTELDPELKTDRIKRRELLEDFCRDYAHRMRKMNLLEMEKAAILADFKKQWDEDGDQLRAIKNVIALDETYPNMILQAKVIPAMVDVIKARVLVYRMKLGQQGEDQTEAAPTVVVPSRIVEGLALLFTPKYKFEARRGNLDTALVEFRVAEANHHMALGSVEAAFKTLREIQRQFPVKAENNRVGELMAAKKNELWMERICTPLGIRKKNVKTYYGLPAQTIDFSAFGAWVIFWFIYLLNGVKLGRRYRHIGSNLRHYMVVFGIFLAFMTLFLTVGHVNHTIATVASLAIPAVVLNVLTQFSYRFFPLIYVRRQLNVKKAVYTIASRLPGGPDKLAKLEGDIANLEMDLPLLHDQWLFRIERAVRLSETDPHMAYQDLKAISAQLSKEWSGNVEQHRTSCLLHMGRIALKTKQYKDAKKLLNDHLEKEPRNGETHALLASLYFTTEDYASAVPHFKVCLSTQGTNDVLWYQLGRCFFEINKYKSAYKCFDTISEPDRDSMFYNARTYACVGKHKKSVEWYQKLLADNPNDGEVIYFLASSFAQLKDDVKAFKIISLIKEGNRFYPHALGLQGSLLLRNSKPKEALEFFRRALREKEDLLPALHGIGQIQLESGQTEASRKTFQRLLQLDPDSPAANYYYGLIQEQAGEPDAVDYFEKALEAKAFTRLAAIHSGRCRYFAKDYASALGSFETAIQAGDTSPWTLFLYADSLVAEKKLKKCRTVLAQLFGHESSDPQWNSRSAKAVYSIGYRLFSQGDYHMASQCFEYVREQLPPENDAVKLEELIAETRFRTIVDLIRQKNYSEASAVVAELQLSTVNPERTQACQFYMALCKMYENDFAAADNIIAPLLKESPGSVRYQYHNIICKLGSGDDKTAADLLTRLRDQTNLPEHITVGIAMIRAYMLAILDKIDDAEQLLADLPQSQRDNTSSEYIRYRLLVQRAEYLCRIQDDTRLQFLLGEMDDKARSHAAYLQALSSLEGGRLSAAVNNLQPYATNSEDNSILFCALASNLASDLLRQGQFGRAFQVLELVPEPTDAIEFSRQALQMAGVLENIDDAEGINEGIVLLTEALRETKEPLLVHSLTHNLAVLKIRLAMVQEETRDKEDIEELWQEVWEFWTDNIFENHNFWQDEYARISGQAGAPLGEAEIEKMITTLREDIILPTFIGFTLAYLSGDGQTDLNRHINYIIEMGKEDNKLKDYVQRLGITAKHFADSRDKHDPLIKTWGFVIGYLQIQLAVRQVLNPDETGPLEQQLRAYLDYRNHYASPSDYMQAKKEFNTRLLDSLQDGIEGKFTKSGEAIEKCLVEMPHGIVLDKQLEGSLWKLREMARKPGAAAERDINLSQEYERMYQRALNHSLQKGN